MVDFPAPVAPTTALGFPEPEASTFTITHQRFGSLFNSSAIPESFKAVQSTIFSGVKKNRSQEKQELKTQKTSYNIKVGLNINNKNEVFNG